MASRPMARLVGWRDNTASFFCVEHKPTTPVTMVRASQIVDAPLDVECSSCGVSLQKIAQGIRRDMTPVPEKPAVEHGTPLYIEGDDVPTNQFIPEPFDDSEFEPLPWTEEAKDIEIAQLKARLAALEPHEVPRGTIEASGPHALDAAPVNSKIVVVIQEGAPMAVLSDTMRVSVLPKEDPASQLPVGARIVKRGESDFTGWQLNPAEDHDMLVGTTASEVIQGFIPHFHPLGGTH